MSVSAMPAVAPGGHIAPLPAAATAVRLTSIDVLKSSAIIAVIWIHAFQDFGDIGPVLIRRLAFLTRFAVPAFFFASAFLNAYGRRLSLRQFTQQRLVRLLVPYLIASVLAFAFRRAVFSEQITRAQALFELATGGAWGIYYFVPLLLGAAIVGQCVFRFRSLAWPLFVVFLVLGLLSEMWIIPFGGLYAQTRNPFRWWGYFFAGWVVALYFAQLQQLTAVQRRRIGGAALAVTAAVFLYYTLALPSTWSPLVAALQYIGIYGIVAGIFVLSLHARDIAAVRWLSEATYPIYLYHFFIIDAVHRLPPSTWRNPASFVLGCVGSIALVYVGRRALGRHARLLIG